MTTQNAARNGHKAFANCLSGQATVRTISASKERMVILSLFGRLSLLLGK